MEGMCPHCGEVFVMEKASHLIPVHDFPNPSLCPGSGQYPRNPESDKRPLWKDGEFQIALQAVLNWDACSVEELILDILVNLGEDVNECLQVAEYKWKHNLYPVKP
jgi:hypothetical protein